MTEDRLPSWGEHMQERIDWWEALHRENPQIKRRDRITRCRLAQAIGCDEVGWYDLLMSTPSEELEVCYATEIPSIILERKISAAEYAACQPWREPRTALSWRWRIVSEILCGYGYEHLMQSARSWALWHERATGERMTTA